MAGSSSITTRSRSRSATPSLKDISTNKGPDPGALSTLGSNKENLKNKRTDENISRIPPSSSPAMGWPGARSAASSPTPMSSLLPVISTSQPSPIQGRASPRTTTSRRGGRARSRSPVNSTMVMMQRDTNDQGSGLSESRESPQNFLDSPGSRRGGDQGSRGGPSSPENPSSAAAAAAAAAKAHIRSHAVHEGHHGQGSEPQSWYHNQPSPTQEKRGGHMRNLSHLSSLDFREGDYRGDGSQRRGGGWPGEHTRDEDHRERGNESRRYDHQGTYGARDEGRQGGSSILRRSIGGSRYVQDNHFQGDRAGISPIQQDRQFMEGEGGYSSENRFHRDQQEYGQHDGQYPQTGHPNNSFDQYSAGGSDVGSRGHDESIFGRGSGGYADSAPRDGYDYDDREVYGRGGRGVDSSRPRQTTLSPGPLEQGDGQGDGQGDEQDGNGSSFGVYQDGRRKYAEDEYFAEEPRGGSISSSLDAGSPIKTTYVKSANRKEGAGSRATSRVIGTSTPIHVPRAGPDPRGGQSGGPASVFRERPEDRPNINNDDDDESPQKILLSLRTPTTSFEERDDKGRKGAASGPGGHQAPLSPEEPPQIQHSHHQHQDSNSLFFEPQRSPRQPGMGASGPSHAGAGGNGPSIETAPSFNLFTQSFDSLGDTGQYLGGPLESAYSFPTGANENEGLHGGVRNAGPTPIARAGSESAYQGGGVPANSQGGHLNSSVGNQPYLGRSESGIGPTGSMLMLGMSPTNSFGNGPPATQPHRDRSGMMMLGDSDARDPKDAHMMMSSYPTQTHEHDSRGSPLHKQGQPFRSQGLGGGDSAPMRPLGSSSFADRSPEPLAPTSKSPQQDITHERQSHPQNTSDQDPNFYNVLCRYKRAFKRFSFLLPGLKNAMSNKSPSNSPNRIKSRESTPEKKPKMETKSRLTDSGRIDIEPQKAAFMPAPSSTPTRPSKRFPDPSPTDIEIAQRRVSSAVCAFGGYIAHETNKEEQSIFRTKDGESKAQADMVTSTSDGPPRSGRKWNKSEVRIKYEEQLVNRYYENDNRLSWEFEESPPVESASDQEDDGDTQSGDISIDSPTNKRHSSPDNGKNPRHSKKSKTSLSKREGNDSKIREDDSDSMEAVPSEGKTASDNKTQSGSPEQPKMRYRCKLCGKPKQNHTCPYQQSLQRSIGIMVYPAVNAFTSSEPGLLAPALAEMNNFVSSGSESSSTETSPSRPTPERSGMMIQASSGSTSSGMMGYASVAGGSPHNVTPETLRSAMHQHQINQMHSPGSSLSTGSRTPQGTPFRRTPNSSARHPSSHHRMNPTPTYSGQRPNFHQTPGSGSSGGRRRRYASHGSVVGSDDSSSDLLFVDATELRPEQYRIVTASKTNEDAYKYPALPLPYAQRKRLSDNLFALSKEVAQLTDECALVLREAREKDMWDLAVAELMTQVIVVIHCPEGDDRLDGLRQYLLSLGIAC